MNIMVEALINLYQGYLIIYFFRNYFDGDKNTWADVICISRIIFISLVLCCLVYTYLWLINFIHCECYN